MNGHVVEALGTHVGRCVAGEMLLRMWEHPVRGEPTGHTRLTLVFTLRGEALSMSSPLWSSDLSSFPRPLLPVWIGTCLVFRITFPKTELPFFSSLCLSLSLYPILILSIANSWFIPDVTFSRKLDLHLSLTWVAF